MCKMTEGDKSVVYNIRYKYKDKVNKYSDEWIAKSWKHFSQSEDYPDEEKFIKYWI